MFVGHLAVARGSKRLEPRVPLGASVAAAFGLDLLWPIFLLLGLETVVNGHRKLHRSGHRKLHTWRR